MSGAPGPRALPGPVRGAPSPFLFGLLVMPFGIVVGYSDNALSYVLRERGASTGLVSVVVALVGLPHAWKLFWAPALDAGTPRKHWFFGSVLVAAASLAVASFLLPASFVSLRDQHRLELFAGLLAIAQAGAATSSAAVDALMAVTLAPDRKGAAAGWSMAGNLGGTGLGGALTVWVTQHVASPVGVGAILFTTVAAFALPGFWIVEPPPLRSPLLEALRRLFTDLAKSLASREGWTGLLICLTPVGTGAATKLFGALADDYVGDPQLREHVVLVVNGLLGGLVGAAGCLLGGYLADRVPRRLLYLAAGVATALAALGLALAPASAAAFTIGTLAYQLANGVAYAAFAAFVLEMVGHGAAVATKYQLFVGASNFAISYVAALDGQGSEWGPRLFPGSPRAGVYGVLGTDAVATFGGVLLLGAVFWLLRRRDTRLTQAHLAHRRGPP